MMLSKKCTHIRIRDNNDYDTDVDNFIKSMEDEYKIDFRSLPSWEKLVQRLHVAATDCKRKIQAARLRKSMIIDKLYIQSTRPSPFELTAGLCRTASKWRKMEIDRKTREIHIELDSKSDESTESEELTEIPHPNTENFSSESPHSDLIEFVPSKTNIEVQVESAVEPSHLPVYIFTNPHKLVSPLGSQFSGMSYKSLFSETEAPSESDKEEWQCLRPTSSVICSPTPIVLTNNTLKQQSVQFTVTNCTGQYVHIRFQSVMDDSHFLGTKILPVIPKRLFPGIPIIFKLIFKLRNQEEFKSGLYFKIGRNVHDEAPPEAFCIPITSGFTKAHSVIVSETLTIPPVYPWHIKRNDKYSTANVRISVNDPYTYHLHIYKRVIDLSKESNINLSLQATGPNTESVAERNVDKDMTTKTIASPIEVESESELSNMIKYMAFIAKSIIELALDVFIFESTYLYLEPYQKTNIPVYFTKAECTGYHQSYYEFELTDPETEKVIMTKTLKVFAEVLPHPIKIHPVILDMSISPVSHGYCEDHFLVTNSHKLYPVTIKIKLTTKMKKMFYVEPMEAIVPESSCVTFAVKFCSRDFLSVKPCEDLVHFTFKIIVLGYREVYENVPPFFYEVIAPCAEEFKKVYNEKYFKEE